MSDILFPSYLLSESTPFLLICNDLPVISNFYLHREVSEFSAFLLTCLLPLFQYFTIFIVISCYVLVVISLFEFLKNALGYLDKVVLNLESN